MSEWLHNVLYIFAQIHRCQIWVFFSTWANLLVNGIVEKMRARNQHTKRNLLFTQIGTDIVCLWVQHTIHPTLFNMTERARRLVVVVFTQTTNQTEKNNLFVECKFCVYRHVSVSRFSVVLVIIRFHYCSVFVFFFRFFIYFNFELLLFRYFKYQQSIYACAFLRFSHIFC